MCTELAYALSGLAILFNCVNINSHNQLLNPALRINVPLRLFTQLQVALTLTNTQTSSLICTYNIVWMCVGPVMFQLLETGLNNHKYAFVTVSIIITFIPLNFIIS